MSWNTETIILSAGERFLTGCVSECWCVSEWPSVPGVQTSLTRPDTISGSPWCTGPGLVIRREDEIIASDNNPSDSGHRGPGWRLCVSVILMIPLMTEISAIARDALAAAWQQSRHSLDTMWRWGIHWPAAQASTGENGGRWAHLISRGQLGYNNNQ